MNGRWIEMMSDSTFLQDPGGSVRASEPSQVMRLDFRPGRFFSCHVERVLADFFTTEDPKLGSLPIAFEELSRGAVRSALDDRVMLEAKFSPGAGSGSATLSLFYRLASSQKATIEQILASLDRRSTISGYHRLGFGDRAAVRGSTRVRTRVVGSQRGESCLITSLVFQVAAIGRSTGHPTRRIGKPSAHKRTLDAHTVVHEPA